MSTVPSGTLLTIDPNDIDTRGQSFVAALPQTDTLASCTVAIVKGTAELATSAGGMYASTATASCANGVATVWIKNAVAGEVSLTFSGVSTAGRALDISQTMICRPR